MAGSGLNQQKNRQVRSEEGEQKEEDREGRTKDSLVDETDSG